MILTAETIKNHVKNMVRICQKLVEEMGDLACLIIDFFEAHSAPKMFNASGENKDEKQILTPLLTKAEIAVYLSVNPQSILNWIARDNFPVRRVGTDLRFDRNEVDAWTMRHRQTPKTKRRTMQKLQNATAHTTGANHHVSL